MRKSMKIDFTLSIVSILAICGIISPIIVAKINNNHNERMKIIDFKYKEFENVFKEFTSNYHKLFIYENSSNAAEFQMSAIRMSMICENFELRDDLINLGNLAMKNQRRTAESDEIFEKCVKQMFYEITPKSHCKK